MEDQMELFSVGTVSTASATDLAWAAGFIDGEGCIAIQRAQDNRKYSVRFSLVLIVGNTDKNLLEHLRDIFQLGSISERKKYKQYWKDSWSWTVTTRQAATVIRRLLPYLVVKKEQAELALEFQSMPKTDYPQGRVLETTLARREFIWKQMRELKGSSHGSKPKKAYKSHLG